jgi:hypothetical protein
MSAFSYIELIPIVKLEDITVLKTDITEREELLSRLDKRHPLYDIMNNELIRKKEKYETMREFYYMHNGVNTE